VGTSVRRLAVGIGSEAKQTVTLLLVGLALGFLLNGQRRMFASRWLWAGAAIAFIGVAPNLIWEAAHSSPTLTMDAQMHAEHSGLDDAVKFPFIVLLVAGLLISPEQVVDGTRGFFRQLPIRRLLWRPRRVAAGIVALNAVLFLPLGLPVLPPTVVGTLDLNKINDNLGEEIGWYEVVDQVIAVWKSLPSDVRQHAAVLTQNYGEAGALIQFHGDASPEVFSGHNSFWSWGPPRDDVATVVAVGFAQDELSPHFRSCRLVGHIHNSAGVGNEEQGAAIRVCANPVRPWEQRWPAFGHYG
jgi:hypothetical protein